MTHVSTIHRTWFPKRYADFVQRLRVASGFVLLVVFAWFSHPSFQSLLLGVPVSFLGLALRAWAAGHLAKDSQLATSGPYAYVRNPLYAGTLIMTAGIVIGSRSAVLAVVAAVVFLLVYLPVIELEEQHLCEIFPSYGRYVERVHRLLPLRRWEGDRRPFSAKLYRKNREGKAAWGLAIALVWMLAKWWWMSRPH